MKTLSDLKRAMSKGSKWQAIHYSGYDFGIREIIEVYTTKVGFKTSSGVSYVYFPKAKDLRFVDGWVEFWGEWYVDSELSYIPLLRYRKVES